MVSKCLKIRSMLSFTGLNPRKFRTSNPSLVFATFINISLTLIQLLQFLLLALLVKVPFGILMTSVEKLFKSLRMPLLQHLLLYPFGKKQPKENI